jgi:hypothetical protein
MFRPYKPFVPQNVSEILDMLNGMMLTSPTFVDKVGYFPELNIDTNFYELNEGLQLIKPKLGEELYSKLREMSDRMRVHFEADPENKTDDTLKGRAIILEMIDLLKQSRRKR